MSLQDLVAASAQRSPEAIAVRSAQGQLTYGELDALANRIARRLIDLGLRRGDRVGLWLEKSLVAVAAMQGVLRAGGAYVPLESHGPPRRAQRIVSDCQMRLLVTTAAGAAALAAAGGGGGLRCLVTDGEWQGTGWEEVLRCASEPIGLGAGADDDLAYILYTSGSTGTPKGVCISHRNALAFVEWAAAELGATSADRFSSHAPLHFDLSVLDLYAAFLVGASVSLIPDAMAYIPTQLVEFVAQERPTIWYSVPSALILMMEHGDLSRLPALPMRAILFAGEPFPLHHLRGLQQAWPGVRLLNLYGPTETNVCTFYDVKEPLPERGKPIPIGVACSGDRVWAERGDGSVAGVGEEGVLMVDGPTVMLGYWGGSPHGERPFSTGDLVVQQEDGNFVYCGRQDQMVKVRGFRVELGEIESALLEHTAIRQVAVVMVGQGLDTQLVAVAVIEGRKPSILELKAHCADRLPRYMIIDKARFLTELPRTRTGKIDRKKLVADLSSERR